MSSILLPDTLENYVDDLHFCARTDDAAYHDTEIARFVKHAITRKLPPSVFEVPAKVFPWLVPEDMWHTPMWVLWVGSGYADAILELMDTHPTVTTHDSTDLLTRSPVFMWKTSSYAFCVKASAMLDSAVRNSDSQVLTAFISPERFAINRIWLDSDFQAEVLTHLHRSLTYNPHALFKRKTLESAQRCALAFGNEPRTIGTERQIIRLEKRVFPS